MGEGSGQLPSSSSPMPSSLLLPPLAAPTWKTVILDLDRTLVNATVYEPENSHYDFQVTYMGVGLEEESCYVLKRPGVDMLLEKISQLDFEIVAFTAGTREYASKVLDVIDPKGLISHRLYRDSCKKIGRKYFKDLTDLGRGMNQVVAVDDHPEVYLFQSHPIPGNVFPVSRFTGRDLLPDRQLQEVVQFLEFVVGCFSDTREAIRQYHEAVSIEEETARTGKKGQAAINTEENAEPSIKRRRCDAVAENGRDPVSSITSIF